jgi:hypothetical protein
MCAKTTPTNDTVPTAAALRASIRSEIDATAVAYRDAVARITAEQWRSPSGNPGWTRGHLAWHIASAVKFQIGLIENARKGKGTNPPSFLLPLGLKVNDWMERRKSRGATRESVIADFDAAHSQLCELLDDIADEEFAVSTTNFGQTRTIQQLFHLPTEHFEAHVLDFRSTPAHQ